MNVKQYKECADAVLMLWVFEVITDAEYHVIMNKLNNYAHKCGIRDRAKESETE